MDQRSAAERDRRRAQARGQPQGPARQGQGRLAREPRGLRERPGARHPDPRAGVRRLRHRGRQVHARRHARGQVHRLPPQAGRLRPAPARRPDDPRKLPLGGITPEQMEAFADVIEQLRAARQGPHHDAPEHPVPPRPPPRRREVHPPDQRRRALLARGLRQHDPQRHRRPLGRGHARASSFDITPYAMAYVRYFVRHPVTQLMPRKVKTAFTATDEDVAITGIHDIGFIPQLARRRARRRDQDRRRHLDHAADRPDPLRVRRARQRRLPEGLRGLLADLRPPGVAARRTAPGPGSRS